MMTYIIPPVIPAYRSMQEQSDRGAGMARPRGDRYRTSRSTALL
jgi:hypothetical protein